MSTLKVSEIRNASSATGGLSIAADGVVSGALPYPNRNLLYNGAMQVAQRGTSTAGITANGYHTADRWITWLTSLGTWTQSVEADGPTGSGLTKSLKLLCTTADAAPAASDQLNIRQLIEGQDVQRIAKGTASASQITLSFWVKSNVTGTYIVEAFDADNTRQVSASYSISASATWEKKTITFPADTTGAFDNDNAGSFILLWWLGAGSTFTSGTLNTTWAASTNANRVVGQTNLAAATSNYWQVTGVQLEVGDTATEFEFKSYGQELAECQRYYWRDTATGGPYQGVGGGIALATSTTTASWIISNPVPMRAKPTAIEFSSLGIGLSGISFSSISNITSDQLGSISNILIITSTGLTQYRPYAIQANNSTSAYIGLSAEL